MESWISGLAAIAVLIGLGVTAYAVARVGVALKQAEQQRQAKDGGESLLLDSKLRELAAAQNAIAGRFSQAIESQAKSQSDLSRAASGWKRSTKGSATI
jgi:uncharacterized protein HemX